MMSQKRFVSLVGGFGCGKSYACGAKAYMLASINHGYDGAIISRSSKQLRDFLVPEVEKFFRTVQAPYSFKDGNKIIIDWGADKSVIHLLTTENDAYTRWAGGNLAWSVIDEIDTHLKPFEVWSFANDRIRVKAPLIQTACASTPEGYGFLWTFFDKEPKAKPELLNDRELIKGCTFDNPHLNVDYVRSQIQTRNPLQLRAYIYGEFVNLDGVSVYYHYSDTENITKRTIADFSQEIPIHIGLDFNKNKNPGEVHVIEKGILYAVDEIYGLKNIDMLIAEVRKRYPRRDIHWYPDASGFEGIQQLEMAFGHGNVHYNKANPKVDRRIASVNHRLCDHTGVRRYFVNQEKCPELANGLLRQTYDANGQPDKSSDLDHAVDAMGYLIHWNWPVGDGGMVRQRLGI